MEKHTPSIYAKSLSIRETEVAIKFIKDHFEAKLSQALNLTRVSAPLLVRKNSGLNDDLNGVERPVAFDVKSLNSETVEVVHSLAKWKRLALKRYGFNVGEGLYTDMNAIRRDEDADPIHSIYVDQWDWEKNIAKEDRNSHTLFETVRSIYTVIRDLEQEIYQKYPQYQPILPQEIHFVSTQEMEDAYPNLSPKEREDLYAKEHKALFIFQIGHILKSGERHDGRAPDYDDWSLNGDIVVYNPVLNQALELSSMGIRVDETSLERQLEIANAQYRKAYPFHKALLNKELPYSMGGGIGQSRLCMFYLRKAHVGEVQASVWSDEIEQECAQKGIQLL